MAENVNPAYGEGRKPCNMGNDTDPWDASAGALLLDHSTAAERAVTVVAMTATVDNTIADPATIPPFSREDWDFIGKPSPCDRISLVCGSWDTVDGKCKCNYPIQAAYLTEPLDVSSETVDIATCKKQGHKTVQVQIYVPQMTPCTGESIGCSEGDAAYVVESIYESVDYGQTADPTRNGIHGSEYTRQIDSMMDCPWSQFFYNNPIPNFPTNPTDCGIAEGATPCPEGVYCECLEGHAGGDYVPCGAGLWTSSPLWTGPYGVYAYQHMLDGDLVSYDNGSGDGWTITPTTPDFSVGGQVTGGFSAASKYPDGSYLNWSCAVSYFYIKNGDAAANANFQLAVNQATAQLSAWHIDSTYISANGQTPDDDAIYPWRKDGRRTMAPIMYQMVGCNGKRTPFIGSPAKDIGTGHAYYPTYTYGLATGELYWAGTPGIPTNVAAGFTVAIGYGTNLRTYKWVESPAVPTVNGDVQMGADAAASLLNLAYAINGTGGTPGTDYYVTGANPIVFASPTIETVGSTYKLTVTSLESGSPEQYYLITTDETLNWATSQMVGSFSEGTPLFDWLHRCYKWESRTVCGEEGTDIWVNFQYGRYSDGGGEATGIPRTACSFTDYVTACSMYPGSAIYYGITAISGNSAGTVGARGETSAFVGGGIVAQKTIEIKEPVPSYNFFRPCGLDRLLMDETKVNSVTDGGASYDAGTGKLTLVFTSAPSWAPDDSIVVYGVSGYEGLWTVDTITTVTVMLKNFVISSNLRMTEAGTLRGPNTERSTPDFDHGIAGKQRFPHAWPINGRTLVKSKVYNVGTGETAVTVADAGTVCVGDNVVFVGSATTFPVVDVVGSVVTITGTDTDVTGYMLNAPYTDGGPPVNPPHWTWFDTRPKGTYWIVSMIGTGTGSAPGDWWGPSCWVQPPGLDLEQQITERCLVAGCCETAIINVPLPGEDGTPEMPVWTCGGVAVNYCVQCVPDPLYQTPMSFPIVDDAYEPSTLAQTWPSVRYFEPCLRPDLLANPSALDETVDLPAGCSFVAPPPPRTQPDGAGGIVDAPLWMQPWNLFKNGVQVL